MSETAERPVKQKTKACPPPSHGQTAEKKRSAAVKRWRQLGWEAASSFQTDDEEGGHADLILDCDVDVAAGVAVTASRDTTLKVRDPAAAVLQSWWSRYYFENLESEPKLSVK